MKTAVILLELFGIFQHTTPENPSQACFQLPKIKIVGFPSSEQDEKSPKILVQRSQEESNILRQNCEKHAKLKYQTPGSDLKGVDDSHLLFHWAPYIEESYEVADVIFQEVVKIARDRHRHVATEDRNLLYFPPSLILSFPSISRQEDLVKLSNVFKSEKCKELLGLSDAWTELYPSAPSPYLGLKFSSASQESSNLNSDNEGLCIDTAGKSALAATGSWVNDFLGKYRLCPYTSSVSRAAVGLSSVGVPVGGVNIEVVTSSPNHELDKDRKSFNTLQAAELVSAFWSETVKLTQSPEEKWATSLVVFPEFDSDFKSFIEICDEIVEPTVAATQSTDIIGRAWFHPSYDADLVRHSKVIPGHAVPHKMVQEFMISLNAADETEKRRNLEYQELVDANNKVRQTPHATINILRRSQLTAAGEFEKQLGDKRPKANSIYVRNAMKVSEILKNQK